MKLSELITQLKSEAEESGSTPNMAVSFYNRRFTGSPADIENSLKNFKSSHNIDIMDLEVTAQSPGAAYGQDPKTVVVFVDSAQVKPEAADDGDEDGDAAEGPGADPVPGAAEEELKS